MDDITATIPAIEYSKETRIRKVHIRGLISFRRLSPSLHRQGGQARKHVGWHSVARGRRGGCHFAPDGQARVSESWSGNERLHWGTSKDCQAKPLKAGVALGAATWTSLDVHKEKAWITNALYMEPEQKLTSWAVSSSATA